MKNTLILLFIFISVFVKSQSIIDTVAAFKVPGTGVSINPPKYFMLMPVKNTFLHPTSSSTIQINEIVGSPFPMLVKNITPEYIETQDAKFISRIDTITNDGKKATVFLISFTVEQKDSSRTKIDYERYMFFTGSYNKTVWMNANYPTIAKDVIAEVMLNSMLTVKFED